MTKGYQELKEKIDAYFDSRMSVKTDKNGQPVTDGSGKPVTVCDKPLTVTGLTLALGLSDRNELFGFRSRGCRELISRALMIIEDSAEEKLFTKEYFNGAKLFLEVNFDRWKKNAGQESDPADILGESGCDKWSK